MYKLQKNIVSIVWLVKSLATVHIDSSKSVTHRGFITASLGSDFIEIEKEVAYLRSTGENPCNVTPDNMGLHNQNTQVSKIRKMEVLIGA